MMADNYVGDISECATNQPLLSPGELLVVGVLQCGQGVSNWYRTALHFVNGTLTSPYYLNNIINPVIVPLP